MDAIVIFTAAGVLGGMTIGATGATAYFLYSNFLDRIKSLENMNNKRLNHKTAANIEDLTASLLYVLQHREIENLHIQQALRFAQMARTDPHNYDPDEPNGRGA